MLPAWVYSVLLLGSVLGSPLSDTQNSTRDHVAHPYPVIPEANSSSTTGPFARLYFSLPQYSQSYVDFQGIMWHINFQSSQKPTLPALL
ncbi:hypothetical protein NFI96_027489 [Prochilodus magdalenae]|nr:hypothetical protein NFI96_027489 [Prochilodus magdalenae]